MGCRLSLQCLSKTTSSLWRGSFFRLFKNSLMGNLALPLTLRKERRCIKIEKRQAVIIAITCLLQGCASIDTETIQHDKGGSEVVRTEWASELLKAAEKGDIDGLQHALRQKGDINVQDSTNRTTLMIATYNQDIEAKKIINRGRSRC